MTVVKRPRYMFYFWQITNVPPLSVCQVFWVCADSFRPSLLSLESVQKGKEIKQTALEASVQIDFILT